MSDHPPSRRLRALLATTGACALILVGVLFDASRRRDARAADADRHRALVDVVGLGDLALSSSARWLRHPSQAEPGAATSDVPSSLDVDPAGAIIGPPREILEVGGVAVERR